MVYRRLGNFHVRNVHAFNFRCVAKWQKLNAHVRNFRMFNFRRLSNWRKIFNGENSPICGTCISGHQKHHLTILSPPHCAVIFAV